MRRFRYGSLKKMRLIGPAKTAHQRCAVFADTKWVDMRQISLPKKAHLFPDVQRPPLISAIFTKDAPFWPCENGASKMRRIRGRRRGRHAPNSPSEKGASFSRCSETSPDFGHFYKRCAILALRKRRIFEWRISRIFFEASYMTKIAKKMRRFRE